MTVAPVKHTNECIRGHIRDVRCWVSAGGAECPPFPAVPSGAGRSVEGVSVQAGGGSRRPGSPRLSKHLDEVHVTHLQKALDTLGLSYQRSCPLAGGCGSNGMADMGTRLVSPDNKREGILCERFWVCS